MKVDLRRLRTGAAGVVGGGRRPGRVGLERVGVLAKVAARHAVLGSCVRMRDCLIRRRGVLLSQVLIEFSHRYVILTYVVILTNILSYDYIISQVFCSCLLLSAKT
jgi:hypothetical protein